MKWIVTRQQRNSPFLPVRPYLRPYASVKHALELEIAHQNMSRLVIVRIQDSIGGKVRWKMDIFALVLRSSGSLDAIDLMSVNATLSEYTLARWGPSHFHEHFLVILLAYKLMN